MQPGLHKVDIGCMKLNDAEKLKFSFTQPGLHKVDIGCRKLNDAEKLRGPFYAARAA